MWTIKVLWFDGLNLDELFWLWEWKALLKSGICDIMNFWLEYYICDFNDSFGLLKIFYKLIIFQSFIK